MRIPRRAFPGPDGRTAVSLCKQALRLLARLLLLAGVGATAVAAHAADDGAVLRIASWNLGWHVSRDELPAWIDACSQRYRRNASTGVWERSDAQDAVPGWQVTERRARLQGVDLARMPPCSVYQDVRRKGVPVTPAAWAKRVEQIRRFISTRLPADVLAFQEVSGTQAVREVLGEAAEQFNICSFDGRYRVQRLAFAWRKSLGAAAEPCRVVHDLSLPALPADDQVRPGLVLGLTVRGRTIRFLNLHLKSSCVSALERGQLDSDDPAGACAVLQAQVAPLEAAFEKLGEQGAAFVVLGDFNRNLWHEARQVAGAEAVRSDGSRNLRAARPPAVRTRNLWLEVNDGDPPESRAVLLSLACAGPSDSARLCDLARETVIDRASLRELASSGNMGCRNPVGLDQVAVSEALAPRVREAVKLPIGKFGGTLAAKPPSFPDPVLAISDHCPVRLTIDW